MSSRCRSWRSVLPGDAEIRAASNLWALIFVKAIFAALCPLLVFWQYATGINRAGRGGAHPSRHPLRHWLGDLTAADEVGDGRRGRLRAAAMCHRPCLPQAREHRLTMGSV